MLMLSLLLATATAATTTTTTTASPADTPPTVRLWTNGAPGSEGKTDPEKPSTTSTNLSSITSVHKPSLTLYLPSKETNTKAAVVVIPGGGHRMLAIEHEGYAVGRWLQDKGIAAFVLKYRLAREEGSTYDVEKHALADTQRAIRLVRSKANEWDVDPKRVGVLGFSAGGELAALAATRSRTPKKRRARSAGAQDRLHAPLAP